MNPGLTTMTSPSNRPQFLLLLHQPHTGPAPTPEEMRQIMDRFAAWMDGLCGQGLVLGTNGLEPAGAVLRGPRGVTVVSDGPFAEAKEIVGGYILVTADSLDHAVAIARDCPGLDYRMAVEVRPVKQRHECA